MIVKITGGISKIVTKQQANAIISAKWGKNGGKPTASPTDPIELEGVGIFQVKDIRAVLDEDTADSERYKHAAQDNKALVEKTTEYRERVKTWDALKKAERMLKTYCYLCYRAKGNIGDSKDVMLVDPIYSKLMPPMVEYFENNPKEIHAPKELYENLIDGEEKKIGAINFK